MGSWLSPSRYRIQMLLETHVGEDELHFESESDKSGMHFVFSICARCVTASRTLHPGDDKIYHIIVTDIVVVSFHLASCQVSFPSVES